MIHSRVTLVCLCALGLATASRAAAQDINLRLSIKYILDNDGNRPSGRYDGEAVVIGIIEQTNQVLRRWGRGYQYVVTDNPFPEVQNAGQFFVLVQGEAGLIEAAAEAAPAQFFWRLDAVNIYIISSYNGGGAGAAIPSGEPLGGEIVVYSVDLPESLDTLWPHEIGHHWDLYHTFDDDGVGDTEPDPSPFQCIDRMQCPEGGTEECCCATKIANLDQASQDSGWTQEQYDYLRWNIMSYYGSPDCDPADRITFDNMIMTPGQLDRWSDGMRQFHAGESSGHTYFVDLRNVSGQSDGYSRAWPNPIQLGPYPTVAAGVDRADAGGGDIVLIRGGSYNEALPISKPVVLRGSGGSVIIGE